MWWFSSLLSINLRMTYSINYWTWFKSKWSLKYPFIEWQSAMLKLLWFICFFNDSCSKLISLLKIITWMHSLLRSKHKSPLTVQQLPLFVRILFLPAQPQGQLFLWATLKLLLSLLLQWGKEEETHHLTSSEFTHHPKCSTVLCRVAAAQTGSSDWLREDNPVNC